MTESDLDDTERQTGAIVDREGETRDLGDRNGRDP